MEEKAIQENPNKITAKEEAQIRRMVKDKKCSFEDLTKRFTKIPPSELTEFYERLQVHSNNPKI